MSAMLSQAQIDQQFEIAVRRLANDLRYGTDLSNFVGSGVDYAQSRPFVDGDPVKDIDWRVTARTARFHLKQYESVKAIPIYLVVDTSASMAVSSQPLSKQLLAAMIAGGMALAGVRRLSPVGLMACGQRLLHFKPTLSRAHVFTWLQQLRYGQFSEQTAIGKRLDELQEILHSQSLVVVISDLHDADAVSSIKQIAQQHDCIVLQLRDPAEVTPARAGFVRGREAETGRDFVAGSRRPWFARAGQPAVVALRGAGIDCLTLQTDQPFVEPLRRLLASRGGIPRTTR